MPKTFCYSGALRLHGGCLFCFNQKNMAAKLNLAVTLCVTLTPVAIHVEPPNGTTHYPLPTFNYHFINP
jgi:hypothetical protein